MDPYHNSTLARLKFYAALKVEINSLRTKKKGDGVFVELPRTICQYSMWCAKVTTNDNGNHDRPGRYVNLPPIAEYTMHGC